MMEASVCRIRPCAIISSKEQLDRKLRSPYKFPDRYGRFQGFYTSQWKASFGTGRRRGLSNKIGRFLHWSFEELCPTGGVFFATSCMAPSGSWKEADACGKRFSLFPPMCQKYPVCSQNAYRELCRIPTSAAMSRTLTPSYPLSAKTSMLPAESILLYFSLP